MENRLVLMQGNEACVEGAIAAGMRFFAGYPITPSTEIAEGAALRLPVVGGRFMQMEDEISSMAAVIGASVTGTKAMTATSGPGFSLKQENIGYAAMCEIPCVIVDVQRYGPSTGLPTSPSQADVMQARWGTHGDHPIIALSPSSVQETYTLIIRAFSLSEKYRTPVIFLTDEIVGHMREGIAVPDPESLEIIDRPVPADVKDPDWKPYGTESDADTPQMPAFGQGGRFHITGLVHDERGYPSGSNAVAERLINRLHRKIEWNLDDIISYEERQIEDADVAVLCYGGTARSVQRAITAARKKGMKVGMFRPITIWPFPEGAVKALQSRVKHIIVVEHNRGQISREVERLVKDERMLSSLYKIDGTVIMPDEVLAAIEEVYASGKPAY